MAEDENTDFVEGGADDLTDYSLDHTFRMNEMPPFVPEGQPNPTLQEILDSVPDRTKYRYLPGQYAPNPADQDVPYQYGPDLVPGGDHSVEQRDQLLQAGINQVAGAMMEAEDRAEQTPNVPVVDVYHTDDTMLRVQVTVEDDEHATGYDENDIRDANRPFIPVSWRRGSGVVSNLYPIEIHDAGGHLIGAWGARELQITYRFGDDAPATHADMIRWIQARVDVTNEELRAHGQPPIPVLGRDVCATCGVPLSNLDRTAGSPYVTVDRINYCVEHGANAE